MEKPKTAAPAKSSRFYLGAVLLMSAVTLLLLGMSLLHIQNGEIFRGAFTAVLLLCMAVLTAVCLCIEQPKGGRLYKFGFYLLHGGLVILLFGFLLSRFFSISLMASVPVGDDSYGSILQEDGTELPLGFYLGVTDIRTEYYEEGTPNAGSPKHYEATLKLTDMKTLESETKSLTVNHPLRCRGNRSYKIYLMSFSGDDTANLLLKSDPAESTILVGILLLLAGSVCMCLLAPFFPLRKKAHAGGGNENEGRQRDFPTHPQETEAKKE